MTKRQKFLAQRADWAQTIAEGRVVKDPTGAQSCPTVEAAHE